MGAPFYLSRGSRADLIWARAIEERAAKRAALEAAAKSAPIPVGKRGAARLRLSISAKLVSRYATHRCILIDLSCTGAQVGLEEPLDLEETAILQFGETEIFCEVVRSVRSKNGGINGFRFDPELEEADVLEIRAYAETYERDQLRSLRAEIRNWVDGLD